MKKSDAMLLFVGVGTLLGIWFGYKNKFKWWYYLLVLPFLISPMFGYIGYAIGKPDANTDDKLLGSS